MRTEALAANPDRPAVSPFRAGCELFLISLLILFLELACIRWFPAHVMFLTFFTNTVLLACFLGMSIGCLAASHQRNYLAWTPYLLVMALVAAYAVEAAMSLGAGRYVDVGNQASPQLVFFGTEYNAEALGKFRIPIEVVEAFFFVIITLALVGPGQELGRSFNRLPNRVRAYTVNIFGSVVGIAAFALLSWLELSPFWWFLPVALGLAYFLSPGVLPGQRRAGWAAGGGMLVLMVLLAGLLTGTFVADGKVPYLPQWAARLVGADDPEAARREFLWSPYYRIDYDQPPKRLISVNLIGHQVMVSHDDPWSPAFAYALPHLFNRDAGGQPFQDVLVIGAGSGNDLSRALQWDARHVDAVEIDPVIQRLGQQDHPDRPYDDPRVHLHLDDGRNFLRSSDRQYDLIVYALVDSLVLHSSYSNIRLESYLFTRQAFEDVKKRLKPGGIFVMYNFFRQGWIVARLRHGLQGVFDTEPLVLTLPYQRTIDPEQGFGGFTLFMAGPEESLRRLRDTFARHDEYWLAANKPPGPASEDGFRHPAPRDREAWHTWPPDVKRHHAWVQFGLAQVGEPAEPLRIASDDWPFLYLRRPMIPDLSLRGMAIMGVLGLALLYLFTRRREGKGSGLRLDHRMFFLGAGFMLIETKAVVHMALLFGSTWMVNSVVFFAVLVMILGANLFVLTVRPQNLWPYYAGLFVALVLNSVIPLDFFLGMNRAAQVIGSCLLVFAPILFAGVIFAVSFGRTTEPDRAFGANIAGAMLGGLAENTSMLLGFQYLVLVALGFYALSALGFRLPVPAEKTTEAEAAVQAAEGG